MSKSDDSFPLSAPDSGASKRKNEAGGSAAAGGMNLQASVSALIAAHCLARVRLGWLSGKVVDIPIEVSAETNGPGDDIQILLEEGSIVEAQVKKGLNRGQDLWDSLIALARGIHSKAIAFGVLVIDTAASGSIRGPLTAGIERIGQGRLDSLHEIALDFHKRLSDAGIPPEAACSKLRIVLVHCTKSDNASEHLAKVLLLNLCAQEDKALVAWHAIESAAHRLIEVRGRLKRDDIQLLLKEIGIDPVATVRLDLPAIRSGCVWEHMPRYPSSQGHIQRFRQSYLISERLGSHAFGGREIECDGLDAWLADPTTPSRFLLCAPTARGKSALLVRWTEQFASDTTWAVAFVPISLRFGTDRPSVIYEMIASQLATILDVALAPPQTDPESYYRSMSGLLLKQAADSSQHVLLVIDGLDEASSSGFDPTIIPPSLGDNIRVLISAREQAGDRGTEGWLRRLEWQRNVRVVTDGLSVLGRSSIALILQSVQIDESEISDELLDRLMNLSGGEPMLVSLYAEDLAKGKHDGRDLSITTLSELKPGFASYFARAFDAENLPAASSQEVIDATLGVLAIAQGPIEGPDLTSLVCTLAGVSRPLSKERFIKPLKRYIAGDGSRESGYVLNHPKLGEYLREERFDDSAQRAVEESIIAWGRATVARLDDRHAPALPPYLRRHLLKHFQRRGGLCLDDVNPFLSDEWRQSWHSADKDYSGYSDSLICLAGLLPPCRSSADVSQTLRVRLKIALLVGSVKSQGINMPAELVALALDENLLTLQQSLNIASLQMPSNWPGYLLAIGKHLTPDQLEDLASKISKTEDLAARNEQLARLCNFVLYPSRAAAIRDLLEWVSAAGEVQPRLAVFVALTPTLTNEQIADVLQGADIFTMDAKEPHAASMTLAQALATVHERQLIDLERRIVDRCLQWIESLSDTFLSAAALKSVAPYLDSDQLARQIGRLQPLLAAEIHEVASSPLKAGDVQDQVRREHVKQAWATLATLECNFAPAEFYSARLMETLKPLFVPDFWSCRTLLDVLPIVKVEARDVFTEALRPVALSLQSANNRTHALMQLAKFAKTSVRQTMVMDALSNARRIEDAYTIAMTLVSLFPGLHPEEKELEYEGLVSDIRKIPYAPHLGSILLEASDLLPAASKLRDEGLHFLMATEGIGNNVTTVLRELRRFPAEERQAVFEQCWQRIQRSETIWTPHQYGSAAHYAGEHWTEAHLDAALLVVDKPHREFRTHEMSYFLPVARRLGRRNVIERFFELMAKEQAASERVTLSRPAMVSMVDDDRWGGIWRSAWFDLLHSAEPHLRTLIDTFQELDVADQVVAWPELIEKAKIGPGSADALIRLAQIAEGDGERVGIFEAALTACSSGSLDQRFGSAAHAISAAPNAELQMRAIDLLSPNLEVSRDNALSAIRMLAPVISDLGGASLAKQLMTDVRLSAEWWP